MQENLSTRNSTQSTNSTDYLYKVTNDGSSDFKIERDDVFGQNLSQNGSPTFNSLDCSTLDVPTLKGGLYTATLTSVSNVDSFDSQNIFYLRIKNFVKVYGLLTLTTSSPSGSTVFRISVPVATTFSDRYQCGAFASMYNVTDDARISCGIGSSSSTNSIEAGTFFDPGPSKSLSFDFVFFYEIV